MMQSSVMKLSMASRLTIGVLSSLDLWVVMVMAFVCEFRADRIAEISCLTDLFESLGMPQVLSQNSKNAKTSISNTELAQAGRPITSTGIRPHHNPGTSRPNFLIPRLNTLPIALAEPSVHVGAIVPRVDEIGCWSSALTRPSIDMARAPICHFFQDFYWLEAQRRANQKILA